MAQTPRQTPTNSHRRQAALARTRDTARRACDYGPAPYGVTVQSAAPSSFHASAASIPSHISCRSNLDVHVSRCISLYLVVSFSLSTSLYVAVFLVLLHGLTLSVCFLEVTLAIDELRGLRLLLLTLSFLEVLALAKDELRLLLGPPPLPGLRGGTWGAKGGPLR